MCEERDALILESQAVQEIHFPVTAWPWRRKRHLPSERGEPPAQWHGVILQKICILSELCYNLTSSQPLKVFLGTHWMAVLIVSYMAYSRGISTVMHGILQWDLTVVHLLVISSEAYYRQCVSFTYFCKFKFIACPVFIERTSCPLWSGTLFSCDCGWDDWYLF